MHAKRTPSDPPDSSLAPTREVDSVSLVAASLILEHEEAESGRRQRASRPAPSPSPSPPPSSQISHASLRDSLLPDEPSRSSRTVAIVGGIVALVLLSGAAAFLLSR